MLETEATVAMRWRGRFSPLERRVRRLGAPASAAWRVCARRASLRIGTPWPSVVSTTMDPAESACGSWGWARRGA